MSKPKFYTAFNADTLQWEVRSGVDTIKPCSSEGEAVRVTAYLNSNLNLK